jgi:hypothetical protein
MSLLSGESDLHLFAFTSPSNDDSWSYFFIAVAIHDQNSLIPTVLPLICLWNRMPHYAVLYDIVKDKKVPTDQETV